MSSSIGEPEADGNTFVVFSEGGGANRRCCHRQEVNRDLLYIHAKNEIKSSL